MRQPSDATGPAAGTNPSRSSRWPGRLLVLVLLTAAALRLYNLSWDNGYLFHPDERKILMVADQLRFPWPPDWSVLLSPESPWNPRFFAYGSLPLYVLRLATWLVGLLNPAMAELQSSYLVGRVLSVLFDLGTVWLVFGLGRRLFDAATGLLAATLVASTVLHIQLAHFYAVDTVLTFFILATVYVAVGMTRRARIGRGIWLGVLLGLSLATKVSAAPLGLCIVLAWFSGSLGQQSGGWRKRFGAALFAILGCFITGLVALIVFMVCEPYAVVDVVTFAVDVIHESRMARGTVDLPYTRQFIGTLPYLYPLWQAALWSMGLPLGMASYAASLVALVQVIRRIAHRSWQRAAELAVPIAWVAVYFGITGSFHAKFLRYMLPVVPLLCLWCSWALTYPLRGRGAQRNTWRVLGVVGVVAVLAGNCLYALAYLNVYRHPHPWVQTTAWLCRSLPPRSSILVEHWDDPLPLIQGTRDLGCYSRHDINTLPAYSRDTTQKLETLLAELERNDYLVLASNRLYNTIPRLPDRYPLTSRYYQLLLGERLGFEAVYFAAVYPSLFGWDIVDDTFTDPLLPRPKLLAQEEAKRHRLVLGRADESYSVYDHPLAMVFRKTRSLTRGEYLALLGDAATDLPEPSPTDARGY